MGRVTLAAGTYRLGPAAGRLAIRTSRAGLAARVGHDLLIEVADWSAVVTVPADDDLAATTITAELSLDSLAVREGTGGARPLSARDRTEIGRTMRKILGGGTASFSSVKIIASAGSSSASSSSGGSSSGGSSAGGSPASGGAIEGSLTLNQRTQPIRLQVVAPGAGRYGAGRYRGSGTVLQTAFGITPYSGLFGALKLNDAVTVEFDLDLGRPA